MAANIIDGKAFAAKVRAKIATNVSTLKVEHGVVPGLSLIHI